MSKHVNIGSMRIDLPDYNTDVGQAVEKLQNLYEQGEISSLLFACVTKSGLVATVVGDYLTMPTAAIAASTLGERVVEDVQSHFYPEDDGDE